MALRLYRESLPPAMTAARRAADELRAIAAGSGALDIGTIQTVQTRLAFAKRAATKAIADMQTSAASGASEAAEADAYLAAYGGPGSLADFGAAMVAIDAAAQPWGLAVDQAFVDMCDSASETGVYPIRMVPSDFGGFDVRQVQYTGSVPAAISDGLRQSAALADLIAAFEAAGA